MNKFIRGLAGYFFYNGLLVVTVGNVMLPISIPINTAIGFLMIFIGYRYM